MVDAAIRYANDDRSAAPRRETMENGLFTNSIDVIDQKHFIGPKERRKQHLADGSEIGPSASFPPVVVFWPLSGECGTRMLTDRQNIKR